MSKINFNDKKIRIGCVVVGILLLFFLCCLFANCSHSGNVYNVENYGAIGDGKTDCTKSVQKAIDDCSNNGGGQVYFPPSKTFITGPVEFKSNCDIHLSANSV